MNFLAGWANSWDKYDAVWLGAMVIVFIVAKKMRDGGNGELRDFLHENGVKLIVLGASLCLVVFAHHSAAHQGEEKFAEWCMAKAGEALACFFGLIQGVKQLTTSNGTTVHVESTKVIPNQQEKQI